MLSDADVAHVRLWALASSKVRDMARVKRGHHHPRQRNRILDAAKVWPPQRTRSASLVRAVEKAGLCVSRPQGQKRNFRALWIRKRINAAVRGRPDQRPVHARPEAPPGRSGPEGSRRIAMHEARAFKGHRNLEARSSACCLIRNTHKKGGAGVWRGFHFGTNLNPIPALTTPFCECRTRAEGNMT